ncbi:MAG: hypothetical protein Q9187_004486 [Circinaria calcarea]
MAEEEAPVKSQFLVTRGKSASPPLCKRVIVYDGDQKTAKVTSEKNVISSSRSEQDEYQKLRLPRRQSSVTIFVDSETKSKPTVDNVTPEGHSNVMLAKLYLDRLGSWAQVLRFLGQLSTVYVKNIPLPSETSSMYSI